MERYINRFLYKIQSRTTSDRNRRERKYISKNYSNYEQIILTHSWVQNTWEFMSKHNITLPDKMINILMRQYNNSSIMNLLLSEIKTINMDLKVVNKCRIYLQAFSISDITESNSVYITEEAWWGKRNRSTLQ